MKAIKDGMESLLKSMQQTKQRQEEEEMQQLEERESAKLIQLPVWPEMTRGVPNSILRGSLFAAIHGRYAKHCKREILHDSSKMKIIYTGERLTQSDLDVWKYALHIARQQCLGHKIYITERNFLKEIGRATGKANHQWLKGVFAKLVACCVEINHEGKTYGGSLVDEFYREEASGKVVLIINPKIARLYDAGHTYIQWEERRKIGSLKPLALWLHGYIATHAKWYPHKVETLRDLSGSETRELRFFKKSLKQALEHLENISLIKNYRIDEKNLVHIERDPTKSQKKHLEEKPR